MDSESSQVPTADTIEKIVGRLAVELQLQARLRPLTDVAQGTLETDPFQWLISAAKLTGIFLVRAKLHKVEDIFAYVSEGKPVVLFCGNNGTFVLERRSGRSIEATQISEHSPTVLISRRRLRRILSRSKDLHTFVANKQLECDSLSSAHVHGDGSHQHPTPLRRFLALLNLDHRDIKLVFLFASVAGILALATPLAVESLVNVVSWGSYMQPLIVLGGCCWFAWASRGFSESCKRWLLKRSSAGNLYES